MSYGPPQPGFNIQTQQPAYQPGGYPYPPPNQPGYMPQNLQPQGMSMMGPGEVAMPMPTIPGSVVGIPPGLEYLTQVDQLLVKQKRELLEAFIGFETKNRYSVKNSLGQKIYSAKEDTDCCTRNCCGPVRPFDLDIYDNFNRRVLTLNRPLRCTSCLFFCCLQKLTVHDNFGNVLGYLTQQWSLFKPVFKVKNANHETVLRIEGPVCTFSLCGSDVKFKVLSRDGTVQVGTISKQWSGLLTELLTDADHFNVSFPMDLDVNIKAVLLGAVFLIDFMFFEKQGNKERDRIG